MWAEAPGERPHPQGRDQRERYVCRMEGTLAYVPEERQQPCQAPDVEWGVRMSLHGQLIALEDVARVIGVSGIDLRVLGPRQVVNIIALDSLSQEGQADQENRGDDEKELPAHELL